MANSDIIKIGFDYRASLEQFEKETNGVFEGISDKAGKQKITIQLDAKDDKIIDKIKELQKLKLDKFTFEFGNSGLKEQLQTFDKLENKINEIISLSKGIDLSFNTKNKTEAYNQLKKYADAFKEYYGNEEAMATNAGAKAGYAYYKAYEEALRKGVAQSKLEKVTVDFDVNDSIFSKERIVKNRIKEFENFQKYGNADESNLIAEITLLENRILKFNSAYSQVKANLGDAPITPEITKNIEEYVRLLEIAESRAKDAELFGYSSEDINSDKDLANMYLDFAKEDATTENKKYIESLKQEETQAIATAEAEQKLVEAQKETVSNTSNSNNSQIEELKSDIQEVKTELGDVKDRISSIESNGFENVREDVEKTKESVKELNSELTEMKSNLSSTPQESNISLENNPRKDAFPDKDISASVESATNSIKEENNVLEQNTQKVKENTQAKEQNTNANLNKYDKRLDSYNGKVDKYQATIDRFKDGGWSSDTYLKNVQAVKNAVNEYETLLNELKGKDASLVTSEEINRLDNYEKKIKDTIATVTNMSAAEKGYKFEAGQKELDKIHKLLNENSKMSSEAKAKIKAYYKEIESGNPSMSLDKIHGEILKIYNAEVEAGRAGRSFFDTLKNSGFHQIAAQMAGMFGFYDVINLGKEGLNVVRELNTALTEMRKVSDESLQSLKNYQNTTFDVADAVGTTAKQIQTSTADYMRLGESLDVAAESAKTANVLLNVSEFDNIEDATKSLVAMGQAYKDLDKMTIVDKLNEVGNNYAISTDELATALQKSSATLSLMGNTIDEAASLVTTANATIQDADSVSAGLRTISLRLVGTEEAEEELSAMNEEVDAFVKATNSKKQQIIKDYTAVASNNYQGFDILDGNGNYKNTYQILLGIAKVYKEIQEQDKKLGTNHATALIEELAGKNRSNIASAILQDPTQLEAVKKSSEEALGSAEKELNSYLDSIDGKMAQLENRAQEFWFKVIDSETIKNGIDLLSTLLKGATDFVDTVGLLPTILTGIGAALSFKNVGRDKMYSLSF